jgi:ketosteroid isomerase-like protein
MSGLLDALERGYHMIWREGRPEEVVTALAGEFEWVVPGHPEGDVRHGPEGMLEFVREWTEPWDELEVDWELEQGAPDRVLATIDMRGRGRGSGVPTEMRFFQLWTFRDDRAIRMELYWDEDEDEARRAAGLDP